MTTSPPRATRPRLFAVMIAASLGVGWTAMTASHAAACSCAGYTGYAEAAAGAEVVFTGRAEATLRGANRATFAVDEVFKGDAPEVVSVHTTNATSGCGFDVGQDERLLVLARYASTPAESDSAGPSLTSSLCGTVPLTGAYALDLPDGYSPLGAAPGESTEFPLVGWLSLLAVAGLGLMPIALWLRLRSRLDQSEPDPRVNHAPGDRGTAPHPFA